MSAEEDGPSVPVTLNVYDLSQGMARQFSAAILGIPLEAIYHTGVSVYGTEFWFGNGIERGIPGRTYFGPPMRSVQLGRTSVPQSLFEEFLIEVGGQFNAAAYSLLRNNCNNFSDEVAQFLVGKGIPREILELPDIVLNSPQGALLAPFLQNLENSIRAGRAPVGATPAAPAFTEAPPAWRTAPAGSGGAGVSVQVQTPEATLAAGGHHKPPIEPLAAPGTAEPSRASSSADSRSGAGSGAAGGAHAALEQEIRREFSLLMALGTLGANEAAAEALRRVVAKREGVRAPV